jgi:hypothetical protein
MGIDIDWKVVAAAGAAWYFFLRPGATFGSGIALPFDGIPGPAGVPDVWAPGVTPEERNKMLLGTALATKPGNVNVAGYMISNPFTTTGRANIRQLQAAGKFAYDPSKDPPPQSASKGGTGLWGKVTGAINKIGGGLVSAGKFAVSAGTSVTKLQAEQARLGAQLKGWTSGSGVTRGAA